MTAKTNSAFLRMSAMLVGAGMLAASAGSVVASSSSGPVRCEIVASKANGMTRLLGVAHAGSALSGSYLFRVSGSGANISQGGGFDARAGEAATLGSVMLGGSGSYNVSLEVKANGASVSCAQRI